MRKFAKIISNIFNYWFWSPIGIFAALFTTGLTASQIRMFFPISLVLDVISPILILYWLIKIGRVKDASFERREDRPLVFGLSTLVLGVSTLLAFLLGTNLFFVLHLTMFLMGVTIFVITLFFKISGHMILNTGFIFILNFLFGWSLLWLYVLIPIVAFARLKLKKHTPLEVLAGTIVGLIEPIVILKLFGFL